MATYYVNSGAGGSDTGGSWTNAFLTYGQAVTAAASAGDVILVHYTHQEELGPDTTYTFTANNVRTLSVDKDSSDAQTAMGTSGWIGNSTLNRLITIVSAGLRIYFRGITFRTAGSTLDRITLGSGAGAHQQFRECYFWNGNTATTAYIAICTVGDQPAFAEFVDCTFRFGHASQYLVVGGVTSFFNCSISSAGSAITSVFVPALATDATGTVVNCDGFDLSSASSTATLIGDATKTSFRGRMFRCKLPSAYTALAAQTYSNQAGAELLLLDCSSGDVHGLIGYHNAFGSLSSSTGVYFTSGAAGQSWKIDTSANCSFATPFETPWIPLYHTGTSSITPYLEFIRDGSATAYKSDEVWGEFTAKTTSGVVLPTAYTDRATIAQELASTAPDQAAGAGLGSWTGESGTAWSGEVDSGSAFTPAEVGYIQARLNVAINTGASSIYLDPQIRT